MNDEERYLLLKALNDLLREKGVTPSSDDLLKFYAATTQSTIAIEERTWQNKVDTLRQEGDIQAIATGNQVTINLLPQGIQFLAAKSPKNWMLSVFKWLFASGIIALIWAIYGHYNPPASISKEELFIKQQKMACGLYPNLLYIQHSIHHKEKRINSDRLQDYLRGGDYLPSSIHIQIENIAVSLKDKNYQAANAQIADTLQKSSEMFGCGVSKTQLGSLKHAAVSADVTTVK